MKEVKFKDADLDGIQYTLDEIVHILGIKGDISPQIPYVAETIRNFYGGLTIGQIRSAFMMVAARKLNIEPFRIFDSPNVSQALDAYQEWLRLENIQAIKNQTFSTTSTLALPEASFDIGSMIQEDLVSVSNGTSIDELKDLGAVKYDYLVEQGLLIVSNEKKWEIYESALVDIYKEEDERKMNKTSGERQGMALIWNSILADIESKRYNPNSPIHGKAVARAKLYSYQNYIKSTMGK